MKKIFFYILINIVFCFLIFSIIQKGQNLSNKNKTATFISASSQSINNTNTFSFQSFDSARTIFIHNLKNPISLLLLQIIIILIASRVVGLLFKQLGQPMVIGEIIAGIILGPSLLGLLFPQLMSFVFPVESFKSLQYLSQIGLTFFMFSVGMDLDITNIKNSKRDAIIISHAGIIIPYFLGMILAYYIYSDFAPSNISFLSFSLFLGISMSVTAFPVLARILQERNLSKTPLGNLAITCAAADDITAWCLLAIVIAVVKAGSMISAVYTIILAIVFVSIMLKFVKPWLEKLSLKHFDKKRVSRHLTAITFIILLISAFIAEVIGIHALFGAFIAGVIMPDNLKFKETITFKIEDISKIILLPIFFAFTGLRTQIGLLTTSHLWMYCGIIILIAVIGKLVGSALTAKFLGQTWKDSISLGILMNTRGLMELIVLNIGYDLGILSPEIFAMLVLMALITTLMTGPLLNLVNLITDRQKK